MRKIMETSLERALISIDVEYKTFFNSLDVADRRFVKKHISHYPRKIQRIIIGLYRKQPTPFLANTLLRQQTEKLNTIIPTILLNHFDAGEQELRELADDMANRCRNFQIRQNRVCSPEIINRNTKNVNANSRQFSNSSEDSGGSNSINGAPRNDTLEIVYQWSVEFVNSKGLTAPEINTKQTIEGCVKRMQDRGWWLRKLRKLITTKCEEVMIHLEKVNRIKGIYCSDLTASNRKYQKQQQLKTRETLTMTNELGEQVSMQDVYDANVSNPVNRRNELMTRMRGFEDTSEELGHEGILVTLTCPSKYHSSFSKSGQRNPKWQGLTPYDGQQYLCNTWSKIRAEFARQDIRTYGLRIAEPQHDGTPHWHMLLFMEKHHVDDFKRIIERYSLEEDGDEKGASENRCDFKLIDPKKGSATGYIAKYVCKNIDGKDLDEGVYGEDPIMAAQRVEAWASCWGIRQFQQIGGVAVTPWRELRKLTKLVNEDESLIEIHNAADSGDWASYTTLMGGVFCIRKSQVIRPYYELEMNKETGLIKASWFDGLITMKLKGILYKGKEIITRIHTWQLGKAGTDFMPSLGVL
ncbi:MAG: hypothetical protein ACI9T7_002458 [Oleiphilaceae bacterium]|jgi:hypothetical protein